MERNARFWRNVVIVAATHVGIASLFVAWSRGAPPLDQRKVIWLNPDLTNSTLKRTAGRTESIKEKTSLPDAHPLPSADAKLDSPPAPEEPKSEIQLPASTPSATAVKTPALNAAVAPVGKTVTKKPAMQLPNPSTKKRVAFKTAPMSSPRNQAKTVASEKAETEPEIAKEKEKAADVGQNSDGKKSLSNQSGGGSASSEFGWYAGMLHDRFYREWIQPTTSVPAGATMSALVRIRIEPDGRISKFNIVRPSGNVVVDESVAAVGKKVKQVDPLPGGLTTSKSYDVNINFELNPNQ